MKRVLVVEDAESVGKMLLQVLSRAGFEARWASTGAEALEMAREWAPQAVLLDLHLADADGLDIARQLRADPATAEARLLGLSGDPASGDADVLDGFLLKPVAFATLLQTLRG